MEDDGIDREGWTVEMVNEDRLDRLFSPLFDMFMEFERTFADHAIDILDVTDEDADAFAEHMSGTEAGRAFGYLLRHIRHARNTRIAFHRLDAVLTVNGWPSHGGGLSFPEIHEQYSKIPKGDA